MTTTRRDFLKQAALGGALAAAPYHWSSRYARAKDMNSRPTIAAIGLGGSRGAYSRGLDIAKAAARHGQFIACCDVDDVHTGEFNATYGGKLARYRDYRALFDKEKPDVVLIATPDHWHVPVALAALESGCDVYCEKPLTLTIEEGIRVRQAVKDSRRVFQVGTQQRSQYDLQFLKAVAVVQSGRLGKDVKAFVSIDPAPAGGPFASTAAPHDLDWDLWLGPAPKVDYCEQRRKEFRWFFEYSGGKMTDWGAHHIDIAQWALGFDHTGPVKVRGKGQFTPLVPSDLDWDALLEGRVSLPNGFNTATTFGIDLEFAGGATIHVCHHYDRGDGRTAFENGILFEGSAGRIFVNRGKLQGAPVERLAKADEEDLQARMAKLYKGKQPGDHMRNFFECCEDRSEPISDVASHQRTMTSCHLCNIALMLGRELRWDPDKEQFLGDDQAAALLARRPRDAYAVSARAKS